MNINELTEKYLHAFYYNFRFFISGETDTDFILNNGDGIGVGDDEDTNIKFMMMKDYLGFEQIDKATYEKSISKFNPDLKFNSLKLVTYHQWIVRVIEETEEKYLLITNIGKPDQDGWESIENFHLKWVSKKDVLERL